MVNRIDLLPHWVLTNPRPAFYESESLSAIEMVARVYAKMQELVEDYNKFIDSINKHITDYETNLETSFEDFKLCVTNTMEDYIKCIDLKIDKQDKVISDAVQFMKDNINESVTTLVNSMRESGELDTAIINAFDNLNVKLDNYMTSVETLTERVEVVEKTEYVLEHNPDTEELMIVKKVGV